MNNQSYLEIRNLVKCYGNYPVIRNVNLSLDKGKIIHSGTPEEVMGSELNNERIRRFISSLDS